MGPTRSATRSATPSAHPSPDRRHALRSDRDKAGKGAMIEAALPGRDQAGRHPSQPGVHTPARTAALARPTLDDARAEYSVGADAGVHRTLWPSLARPPSADQLRKAASALPSSECRVIVVRFRVQCQPDKTAGLREALTAAITPARDPGRGQLRHRAGPNRHKRVHRDRGIRRSGRAPAPSVTPPKSAP